jgi:type I restriction enzyme, R subunit
VADSGGHGRPGYPLTPVTEGGSGQVQNKHKMRLAEIIQAINDLFEGDVTDGDAVAYVDGLLRTKLLESDTLRGQAAANTKEQFANSLVLPRFRRQVGAWDQGD